MNEYNFRQRVRSKIWFDITNEIWSNISIAMRSSIIFDFPTQLLSDGVGNVLIDYREHIRFKLEYYSL